MSALPPIAEESLFILETFFHGLTQRPKDPEASGRGGTLEKSF